MKHNRSGAKRKGLAVSDTFRAFVLDQLADLGDVSARSMFGGVGLYCGETFFAILARDTLFLRVDAETRAIHEAAGMHPFKPEQDRPTTMKYYAVPVEVLESSVELVRWARRAVKAGKAGNGRARSQSLTRRVANGTSSRPASTTRDRARRSR